MCFVHFASICFLSVATFPAIIFLSNVALDPHSILISSGSVHLDFIIFAATFSSTSLFLAPFLFALVLWYRTPSLSPPHLSVFYASPLAFLSFFLPITTSATCLYERMSYIYMHIFPYFIQEKCILIVFGLCYFSQCLARVYTMSWLGNICHSSFLIFLYSKVP